MHPSPMQIVHEAQNARRQPPSAIILEASSTRTRMRTRALLTNQPWTKVLDVLVLASPLMARASPSSTWSVGLLQRSMALNHLVGTQIFEKLPWPSVRAIDMNPTIINSVGCNPEVDFIL
eukprot:c19853_g2_i1 orf=588-947(-)